MSILIGLFDFFRRKKAAGEAVEDSNLTRRGMFKHSQSEFKALTADDVLHVLMLHEASTTSDGYEQHVLSYLLPNLSHGGFTRIDSLHGVNPKSPDAALSIVKRHGYDDLSRYAVAHEFVNDGGG